MQLRHKLLVKPRKLIRKLKLEDWNTEYNAYKKENVEGKLDRLSRQMSELQYKLFASKNRSLLIILQGVDASGKDGTIRHVMGALNPQNCYGKSFKVPTQEEGCNIFREFFVIHLTINVLRIVLLLSM